MSNGKTLIFSTVEQYWIEFHVNSNGIQYMILYHSNPFIM